MKNMKKFTGFTLIELLVVIGIIGVLVALLLPAIKMALDKANKTKAKSEVVSIKQALQAYYNEYSKNPSPTLPPASGTYPTSDQGFGPGETYQNYLIIQQLMSNNTRKIVFLEVATTDFDSNGNFIDPWEKPYGIALDYNFDNTVKLSSGSKKPDISPAIGAIWSLGPDGLTGSGPTAADDIESWK